MQPADGEDVTASGVPESPVVVPVGRHRRHEFPGRSHVVKVRFTAVEMEAVDEAARMAGLRPAGYVGWAGKVMAEQIVGGAGDGTGQPLAAGTDRELLTELIQARLALRRFGVNVNQAVAAINSGAPAPAWLQQAVAGSERAVERVNAAASAVARRLA